MRISPQRVSAYALATLSLCAVPAAAQVLPPVPPQPYDGVPPRWVERTLPPDYGGPSTVKGLGTCVVFQTASAVHLWSAITGTWTEVPASPGAQVTQCNAYVVIEDGATVHGWATRTGQVDTLQLASAPVLHHGSLSSCWLSIAVHDQDAWAFGAFDGQWRHQALAAPGPWVAIEQTTALLDDGQTLFGVSAYHGEFVAAPAHGVGSALVAGDVAVSWSTTYAQAFSAHTGAWAETTLASGAQLALERGYAMFADGADLVAFSGCTGDFRRFTPPAGSQFQPGRYVGAARAGTLVTAYTSGRNAFAVRDFPAFLSVDVDDEVLCVTESAGVTAFSVVSDEFSETVAIAAPSVATNDAMVWADDGAQGWAFSAVLGTWSPPVSLATQPQVHVLRNVVVLADGGGYRGFSGRTGAWVDRPTGETFHYVAPGSGDVFAAFDGNRIYLFDPLFARWSELEAAAPLQALDVWRQTFVGFDGERAHGYGLMNDAWESIDVKGVQQGLDANSSCGYVATGSHLYTYSAHGTLSTWSRFPEFSRLQPLGAPLRMVQSGPPGAHVVRFLGLAAGEHATPFGTLLIDPATIFRRMSAGTIPASGVLESTLDLSGASSLRGVALHVQDLVVPPIGPAWLSNLVAPVLL